MLAGSPSERNACTANDTPPHAVSVSVSGSGSISNNRGDSVGEALLALITPHTNPQCSPPGCKINGIRPLRDTTLHRNPCGSRQLSQISPPTYRRIGESGSLLEWPPTADLATGRCCRTGSNQCRGLAQTAAAD